MKSIKLILKPIVIIVMCVVLVGVLVQHRSSLPYKLDGAVNTDSRLVLILSDVEMVGRNHGEKTWSFKADSAEVTQGQIATTFSNVHEGKIYKAEKPIMTVSAGKAVYFSGAGDIQITNKVKVASSNGFTADTDSADWSGYYQRLTCTGKVTFMAKGGDKLVGRNLIADWKTKEVSLENGQMALSVPKEENPTEILNIGGNN